MCQLDWAKGCPAAAAAKSLQSCPTLCNPIDGSPPGSPIPGILQARTLEWFAISFSNAWKWKVKVKSLSCVQLLETHGLAAYQAPTSLGFSRQEYWSGLPLPSPSPVSRILQFLSDVFWCWSLHPLYQVFVGPYQSGSLCSLVLENFVNYWCIVSSSPILILFSLECLLIRILDLPKDPLIVFCFLSYYPLLCLLAWSSSTLSP